ncbi:MAG TPA: ubiquitin-conjugating enzyme E2 [Tepidisphaeraceae bacterium]|jgi:ubiquitin-protein ligase/DNA-directed RNA polymerase subunit RPC12/RpoP|nr:ubiquitin-conjugating enzyme E2 [Tepidisphaeraceae bacterium]
MSADATTISFSCPQCDRPFAVPSSYAGRKASCKTCGNKLMVPSSSQWIAPPLAGAPARPAAENSQAADGAAAPIAQAEHADDSAAIPTSDPVRPPARKAATPMVSEAQSPPAAASAATAEAITEPAPEPEPAPPRPAPAPARPTLPPASAPRVPVRTRRLMADAQQMATAFADSATIRIKSIVGEPPETYQIEYRVAGLQPGRRGKPKPQNTHLVEIQLASEYPRIAPHCRMLTPVFHPNIDETTICVGDHWTAGERLVDLVARIGEMLAYQAYNIKSPLDGEAAMWADLNADKLPTDPQSLRPSDSV